MQLQETSPPAHLPGLPAPAWGAASRRHVQGWQARSAGGWGWRQGCYRPSVRRGLRGSSGCWSHLEKGRKSALSARFRPGFQLQLHPWRQRAGQSCPPNSPWNSRSSEELAAVSVTKPLASRMAVPPLGLAFSFWRKERERGAVSAQVALEEYPPPCQGHHSYLFAVSHGYPLEDPQ